MKRIAMSAIAGFVLMAAIFFAGCSEDDFEAYCQLASDEDIVCEDNTCFVDSQILLSAQEGVSQSKIKRIIKKLGGDIIGYISITNDYQIEFSDGKTLDELNDIIDTLDEEEDVLSVTLNYTGQTEADSVDYTKDPWTDDENPENVSGTIWSEASPSGNNWWAEAIMMPSVWETDLDLESVKVGIIDTMFDTENEDLDEAFAETWNNPEDEDGNCMVSEMSRYEVEGSDHGTLVAGLIAADAEDEYGIAGVNEAAMLYGFSYGSSPVDTEEVSRWGSIFEFKYAVALMLNEGVKVINMSFGYPEMQAAAQNGDESALRDLEMYSTAWEDYLSKCLDAGYDFLIVKAAGNLNEADWVQCETSEEHPYGYIPVSKGTAEDDTEYDAAYDFLGAITDSTVKDHIIMVGSAENKDGYYAVAAHTCTGDRIDVYAPGVDVLCDYPDNVTKLASGTSVAAPIVTGIASLVWSVNPDLSASQVADIIRASVSVTMFDSESVLNLFRTVETTPIVNAYVAVQLAEISVAEGGKALEETGIVTGIPYVMDADGQPSALENVTVTVYDTEGNVVDADTTEIDIEFDSGGYDFVLPSGTYTITASLDGYDTASKEITVEGKTVLNVDFEMRTTSKTEDELHAIFADAAYQDNEIYFFYDDFDGDGEYEAFGITGEYNVSGLYSDVSIYYISSDGDCTCVSGQEETWGDLTIGGLLSAGNYKFLLWERTAGGSGSATFIYGVKDGFAYEPEISGEYMCFGTSLDYMGITDSSQPEGSIVGFVSDFSKGYHDYLPRYFVFDEKTVEFILYMEN